MRRPPTSATLASSRLPSGRQLHTSLRWKRPTKRGTSDGGGGTVGAAGGEGADERLCRGQRNGQNGHLPRHRRDRRARCPLKGRTSRELILAAAAVVAVAVAVRAAATGGSTRRAAATLDAHRARGQTNQSDKPKATPTGDTTDSCTGGSWGKETKGTRTGETAPLNDGTNGQ